MQPIPAGSIFRFGVERSPVAIRSLGSRALAGWFDTIYNGLTGVVDRTTEVRRKPFHDNAVRIHRPCARRVGG